MKHTRKKKATNYRILITDFKSVIEIPKNLKSFGFKNPREMKTKLI